MASIDFSSGVQVFGVFTFSDANRTRVNLEICKKETDERTYKLAIRYFGLDQANQAQWSIMINDQHLNSLDHREIVYSGSYKFDIRPTEYDVIQIEEKSERGIEKFWVDMAGRSFTVSRDPIEPDESIKYLLKKASLHQPSDNKKVKKIFYHNSIGVILYAADESSREDIYFGKRGEEDLMKCDSCVSSHCKCPQKDAVWKVFLPKEHHFHTLIFARQLQTEGHRVETSWDGTTLRKHHA